ncbi:MAG: polysaccharide biosynthesis C-terminal domain-containing protein [Clostridia bacterium]|nr:polysaccharide biosynthesis C-terminal domain-containing protein [Clostridia bacterium]
MAKKITDKNELFGHVPVPKALLTMAVPTIISQLINLIYNMVDAFFIGRTGNSYMMAATTVTLTMVLMNVALSNLFGIGGGSLVARLMGMGRPDRAKQVSAFSVYGAAAIALFYSLMMGLFLDPVLRFLGASDATVDYARSYALIVIVIGSLPSLMSMTLAHLLRNAGYSSQASMGLSGGGILNVILDPLFMFVIMPRGQEVTGAAIATALSNFASCTYLLHAYRKASREAPLSLDIREAAKTDRSNIKGIFSVGVPSAVLTGLFDVANICVNILASSHSDLVLAAMGIVMKVERVPNAVNVGICQGMLPIVAFNYSAGNHDRMKQVIRTARMAGLAVAAVSIVLFEIFAGPASRMFLSTSAGDAQTALITVGFAALFLRIRCIASPVQFINYHTSYCMQAMGNGKATLLHAFVRELVFYIPFMFLLDRLFGETGLAAALPAGEACGALFALWLLHRAIRHAGSTRNPQG